jgi:DNA-binding NarL/FixJ family response regulator
MPDGIRILVVDDHAILRDGICSLLAQQENIQVVGEAANGREAVEKTGVLLPDLVLMDIAMPEMNGIEATQQIKRLYPGVQVMILTQHDNREYIDPVLRAGASGYVLKRSGGRELVNAIRQVYNQGAFLEPSVARQVIDSFAGASVPSKDAAEQSASSVAAFTADNGARVSLTERELQVLRLLAEGKSNKEVAHLLSISPKTVSVHRANIMTKLNLRSSFDLIRYITQTGIPKGE